LTLLAITRGDVADYLGTLLRVYIVIIIIRILLTWIPRIPYNPVLNTVVTFISDVTDPYLRLFRRILPPLRIGAGALDLSPIVAILALSIVGSLLINAIHG
jgi:YggT family protein